MNDFPTLLTAADISKILKISYHSALDFIKYSGDCGLHDLLCNRQFANAFFRHHCPPKKLQIIATIRALLAGLRKIVI